MNFLSCSFESFNREKACYGEKNNLQNLYDESIDHIVKEQSSSIACMIFATKIEKDGLGKYKLTRSYNTLNQELKKLYHRPSNVSFGNEPSIGFGTAFLVSSSLVLTARHCIIDSIDRIRLVFGFQMTSIKTWSDTINQDRVYEIDHIIDQGSGLNDWVLLKLKKEVVGLIPLELDLMNFIKDSEEIYMLGHPMGLPVKLAGEGKVHNSEEANVGKEHFQAAVTACKGNSGSPIFSKITKKVIGILVAGQPDYIIKDDKVIENIVAKGNYEKCQRINTIKALPYKLAENDSTLIEFSKKAQMTIKKLLETTNLTLDISHTTEQEMKALDWHCIHLKELRLRNLKKDNKHLILNKFTYLDRLNLRLTNLCAPGIENLSFILPDLTNLKSLNLSYNFIGNLGVSCLSSSLTKLICLEDLNLENIQMSDPGMLSLVPALGKLHYLQNLNFKLNQIGDESILALAKKFSQFTNLKTLNLGSNYIEHKGALSLSYEITKLMNLELLNMECNIVSFKFFVVERLHNKSLKIIL